MKEREIENRRRIREGEARRKKQIEIDIFSQATADAIVAAARKI